MIVTERFIYIHLHKSGGTFLNRFLKDHFGGRQLGAHLPSRLIPYALRALPVLGFVRNPWSYYLAWYEHQQARADEGNLLFRHLSDNGALGFGAVVRRLVNLGTDAAALDALLATLPEAFTVKGPNLPRAALAGLRNSGAGFYTHLYNYMYAGHGGALHLGRTDRLPQEFLGFLDRFGIPIGDALRAQVAAQPAPTNDYAPQYDAALRDLVAERDAAVIRAFDYRFAA
jgi:hypothetical protein